MGLLKKLGLRKKKVSKPEPTTDNAQIEEQTQIASTPASSQAIPPNVRPPKSIDLLNAAGFDTYNLDNLSRDPIPFFWACDQGHDDVLKLLFRHNPNPSFIYHERQETIPKEYHRRSPVDVAVEKHHLHCVAIMHRNGVHISDNDRELVRKAVCEQSQVIDIDDICDVVLGDWFPPKPEHAAMGPSASEVAESVFMSSIRANRPDLTKWLWENGLEQYKKPQQSWAAWSALEELFAIGMADASLGSKNPSLEYLQSVGVVEILKENGFYHLVHRLVRISHLSGKNLGRISSLLTQGWDVNGRDRQGYTPLQIAIGQGEVPVVELLIKHGADVNARADRQEAQTCVLLAMRQHNAAILRTLLEHGAQFQPDKQEDVNAALFAAAAVDNIMAVRMLLDKGADPQVKNVYGETPYKVAMLRNNHGAAALLRTRAFSGVHQSKTASMVKSTEVRASNQTSTTVNLKPLDNAILRWD